MKALLFLLKALYNARTMAQENNRLRNALSNYAGDLVTHCPGCQRSFLVPDHYKEVAKLALGKK